jgi:hypothetical protein
VVEYHELARHASRLESLLSSLQKQWHKLLSTTNVRFFFSKMNLFQPP